MKLNKQLVGVTGMALALGMLLAPADGNTRGRGQGNGGGQQAGLSTVIANLPIEDLSAQEEVGLSKMREEEKLARDVYQVLHEKWGHRVFSNIAQSEQQHMEAIKGLLNKYNMVDPVSDSTVGVFSDPELQALYGSLVEQGKQSLVEALKVGATIEDLDIKDLYDFLEETDNIDIKTVYQNLAKGSRNHLRAFTYQLSLNGVTYEAQYLTTEQINDITTAPQERGRVDENGEQVRGNRKFGKKQGRRAKAQGKNGPGTGDCLNAAVFHLNSDLHARGGNGGGGNGGANGSGDGTGTQPQDGTGGGPGTGDCLNA